MLEIPESYTLAKQLNQMVQGKTIQNVKANSSPHGFAFYFGDPARYPDLLEGKAIGSAEALAGLVEITAGDVKLLFGDGVGIRYMESGRPVPKKHQLLITFADASFLVCTVQMYGGLWAFKDGENDNYYYKVAREKPSPLTDQFDESYFAGLLSGTEPTVSAKGFLATKQRIPGLGNGVLQDILFKARVNPKTKLKALCDQERARLYTSVKQTLQEMTDRGGRDTEKDLFGLSGCYKTVLSNKTLKNPCPVCGGSITRQAYMGGNVYFCPVCQPL